jgi:hypothetical protein
MPPAPSNAKPSTVSTASIMASSFFLNEDNEVQISVFYKSIDTYINQQNKSSKKKAKHVATIHSEVNYYVTSQPDSNISMLLLVDIHISTTKIKVAKSKACSNYCFLSQLVCR